MENGTGVVVDAAAASVLFEDLSLNTIELEIERGFENNCKEADYHDHQVIPHGFRSNDAYMGHDRSKKERSLDVRLTGQEAQTTFENLLLKSDIVEGLNTYQYFLPSPVQIKAIPLGKFGYDLIIQSKSGTGKTCAFGVVVLEQLDLFDSNGEDNNMHIQALILAPTREIAEQNKMTLKCIGCKMNGLRVKVFIGGTSVEQSVRRSKSCNVASGTPGRVLHMITQKEMDLSKLKIIVLDEADRLMEASFLADVTAIFESLPKVKQVIAASATYPDGLKEFVKTFMNDPIDVTTHISSNLLAVDLYTAHVNKILKKEKHATNLEERFDNKMLVIWEILRNLKYTQAIIFSRFLLKASKIFQQLKDRSLDVSLLTGALPQDERLIALRNAKEAKCKILVASDLGTRGIDCEGIDLVINFECPDDSSTFVHRFGRAGRFGSGGTSITLVEFASDYQELSLLLKSTQLRVRRLESLQDIENLGKNRTDQLHKLYMRCERISPHDPCNEGWSKFLDYVMDEDHSVESLQLQAFSGFKLDVDMSVIQEDVQNLNELFNSF